MAICDWPQNEKVTVLWENYTVMPSIRINCPNTVGLWHLWEPYGSIWWRKFFKALLLRKGPRKVEAVLVLIQLPKCKHSFKSSGTKTVENNENSICNDVEKLKRTTYIWGIVIYLQNQAAALSSSRFWQTLNEQKLRKVIALCGTGTLWRKTFSSDLR